METIEGTVENIIFQSDDSFACSGQSARRLD